jgi:hypothetical protein
MLLDARPPKPPTGIRKYIPIWVLVVLLALIGSVLVYSFMDYPEERAVENFMTALQQGNYPNAYKLWTPSPTYSYQDFLHDWGEQGEYGKIRAFEILDAQSKGMHTVVVTVRINGADSPVDLAVDRKTKGLAFSPFS